MGQAAIDLPDPTSEPDPPRHQSADDLLSQLASEQIDQLLADGDSEPASAPEAQAGAPDPFEPPAVEKVEDHSAPAPVDAGKEALSAEAAVAAQLDDLFHQISGDEEASAKPQAAGEAIGKSNDTVEPTKLSATAAEVDAALAAGTGPLLPPLDPGAMEDQQSADERAALSTAAIAIEAIGDVAAQAEDDDTLPIYLRPLEWLNAPLDHCPDGVREAFGKIAILTLFNSIAVLIYVLIFRRHH
jgi:hypothetical protein